MTLSGQNQKRFHNWMFLLYLVFLASIIFSLRAVSVIAIAAILVSGLLLNKIESGRLINKKAINIVTIAFVAFYCFQLAGFSYTHNLSQQWNNMRLKSALLFIPLAVNCCDFINSKTRRQLLTAHCLLLFAGSLYCLVAVLADYQMHRHAEVFFYHELVRPLSQHAIQFSVLMLIALLFLVENLRQNQVVLSRYIHIMLVVFFTIFLFLLSSKLFIAFYFAYIVYCLFLAYRNKTTSRGAITISIAAFISIAAMLFFTKNPVSRRFNEVMAGDINFIRQEKFTPGDYFNGLQFRLLQWRFVSEILTEERAWLYGVSPGDAQQKLDEKYISENMYIGEDYRHDRGFLGYNTHNQLLESMLQSGIIGGAIFLFICFSLIKLARARKNRLISFAILVLLLYSFSESVFESQYSLLLFTFFPLFLYNEDSNNG
jgi:hypothetical protein